MKNHTCPSCQQSLVALPAIEVIEHLANHLEELREVHPEVSDEDQLDLGCENLSAREYDFAENPPDQEC